MFFYYYVITYSSCFFFFSSRRRHTRWTGDWSSDVCSSDLPEAAMRRCTDLDLLIAERDIERAARALEPLGYELEDGLAALYARRHHHHLHLAGRCPPVIELHFRAYVGFGVTLPSETLLARGRAHHTGGGAPCWVLAPEDELLYLGVHAAGHCFDRLLWLYDLKLFMSRNPRLDWALLAERARAFGVEAAWALTRDVLKRRLGVAGLQ